MAALAPDARTAVVTLTHDPKLDDPAIRVALALAGLLPRLPRLDAAPMPSGWTGCGPKGSPTMQIARIHAPVGLNIGAKSPAEIAVSILAQITQVLRQG